MWAALGRAFATTQARQARPKASLVARSDYDIGRHDLSDRDSPRRELTSLNAAPHPAHCFASCSSLLTRFLACSAAQGICRKHRTISPGPELSSTTDYLQTDVFCAALKSTRVYGHLGLRASQPHVPSATEQKSTRTGLGVRG